jgi:uncharacterized membrane protein
MPAPISDYVPQFAPAGRRAALVWASAAAGALLILAVAFAAPALAAGGHAFSARAAYAFFGAVCHQMPERSFYLLGYPLAVCARCAGLYAGFAAGLLLYPLARPLRARHAPARGWLFAAAVPTALDFSLGLLGVWENTHLSRSLTGALLGAVAALYVVPGLVDLSYSAARRRAFRVGAHASE